MKKTIIRLICLIFALVMLCSVLTSCDLVYKIKYNEKMIIGKTVEEITEKYGDYDFCNKRSPYLDTDGNLIEDSLNRIGYQTGYIYPDFGTDLKFEKYVLIYFDKDGKAYKIERDYTFPGG